MERFHLNKHIAFFDGPTPEPEEEPEPDENGNGEANDNGNGEDGERTDLDDITIITPWRD